MYKPYSDTLDALARAFQALTARSSSPPMLASAGPLHAHRSANNYIRTIFLG